MSSPSSIDTASPAAAVSAPAPAPASAPRPKKSNLTSPTSKLRKKKLARSVSFALPALPFPLASFLHPLRSASTQWLVVPVVLMVAFLFRWAVGLGPYSGMGSPPMHGDFEAQRHWMEVTTQLPMREWYWHDLEWWGLDYPPLTAYHSWVCGKIGSLLDPSWFALRSSRRLDAPSLKLYMRATAVVSEFLTYVPGAVIFVRLLGSYFDTSRYDQTIALTALLLQPSLILIDHGHFQYNSVMLGLFLLSLCLLVKNRLLWASFFFVLSLTFKQMALYYAPAIFAYLLGLCVFPHLNSPRLILLSATVICTFTLVFLPLYVSGGLTNVTQSLLRIFPFSRGLFEDKVANAWCTLNVLIKLRRVFSPAQLQRLALIGTFLAILPPCLLIFSHPLKRALPPALAACAWAFFLLGFQVHEKSVLLPLVPTTLILAGPGGLDRDTVAWVGWVNNVALFSMWPLLRRDGLALQYAVMGALWAWLMGGEYRFPANPLARLIHMGSYAGIVALHAAELVFPREWFEGTPGAPGDLLPLPQALRDRLRRLPDIWVVGNVLLCFGCFAVMYLWTLRRLWWETEGRSSWKRLKAE